VCVRHRYLCAVTKRSTHGAALARINARVVGCEKCPRLVLYRREIGRVKRRAFRDETYWARPVPSFGDPDARLIIVGLAPAAHGANRTGRMFTGDSSGDWLYRALHRAGFANQPTSRRLDDHLKLRGAYITAAGRCAPPGNKPTRAELDACRPYLVAELESFLVRASRSCPLVVLTLGAIAHAASFAALGECGATIPRPRPRFSHGAVTALDDDNVIVLASYHPSRQNTQTGRLTEPMLDDVMRTAKGSLGVMPPRNRRDPRTPAKGTRRRKT
jgi:uracil-DNA glycosylase family 4